MLKAASEFTLVHFVANDGAFAFAVDILVPIRAPTDAENARRPNAVVAVTFKTGKTLAPVLVEDLVVRARRIRTAVGRNFAGFWQKSKCGDIN